MLTFTLPIAVRTFNVSAQEVIRDLYDRPHLWIRISLSGPHFPHRALDPFLQVGGVRSRFVLVDAEGLHARAYFDQLPGAGRIEFGYGDEVVYVFGRKRIVSGQIARLDRKLIPRETQIPQALRVTTRRRAAARRLSRS